jgi:precorrin-2/cobalt-factor-2 C20-methyltransferase
MTPGTLFGLGVGPGDPELIPVKAVRILKQVDLVFTAASARNDYSLAVAVARPYISAGTVIQKLDFPMSRDPAVTAGAWQRHAQRIADVLEAGRCAAFLTLGDPLTYSTYGYILRHLQAGWPHLSVCTVPGITSYQAAAAAINRPLVEGGESLLIMSGTHDCERRLRLTRRPDNVVLLKAYRNVRGLCRAIEDAGMLSGSVAVADCSRENQRIFPDLKELCSQPPNYWTLIIAKQNHQCPEATPVMNQKEGPNDHDITRA